MTSLRSCFRRGDSLTVSEALSPVIQ